MIKGELLYVKKSEMKRIKLKKEQRERKKQSLKKRRVKH